MLPITERSIQVMLMELGELHERGTVVTNLPFLIPFVLRRCGVYNRVLQLRLYRVLVRLARRWQGVIANDPTIASHDRSDEVERVLMEDYVDPDGNLLSNEEEQMVREVAPVMYSMMAWTTHELHRDYLPPAPQQQNIRRTTWQPSVELRERNAVNQVASQRAGQRREARKARVAQAQAQASRSAVQVSDDALRAVEERAAALELAAAAAAAGQGSSGRRAPTPPPVRTAEEEAAAELAREEERLAEAARLRNEKADAKKKQQEEWLAKQRANKKGKGKGKAPAPAPTEPQEPREQLPPPPPVDYAQAARDAIEDRPPRAGRRR